MPTTFSLHGYVLDAMLHFTADSRGAVPSILSDVLVELTADSLRLVATNTQVMGLLHFGAMNAYGCAIHCDEPQSLVVPVHALKSVLQDKRCPEIQVAVDGLQLTVKNASGHQATVLGRAADAFPAYHAIIPSSPAQPVTGLSVDAALIGRFLAFAKSLRQEASLTLGFHGPVHPCSVYLKHCSAFYGVFTPTHGEYSINRPVWLTVPHLDQHAPAGLTREPFEQPLSHIPPTSLITVPTVSIEPQPEQSQADTTVMATPPTLITPVKPEPQDIPAPTIHTDTVVTPEDAPVTTSHGLAGQTVLYQGQLYPVLDDDGEWVHLDTSTPEKKSWRTVKKSLLEASPRESERETAEAPPISTPEPVETSTSIDTDETRHDQLPTMDAINTVSLARAWYAYLRTGQDFAAKREMYTHLAGILGKDPALVLEAIRCQAIDPRAIDEAYEYAQVLRAHDLAWEAGCTHDAKWQQFLAHYDRQLAIAQRDTTVKQCQQYSTPLPLCYLLGRYLGLDQPGCYYEPTAGNGSLAITADPQHVIVNELDAGPRLAALQDQGFRQVWNEDALDVPVQHRDWLRRMDAVIMNPPFATLSQAVRYHGYKISKLEHLITLRSLELMKDAGRAALIIGGHNFHDNYGRIRTALSACDAIFFNYLYAYYHVVANIDVDGALYKKQGTTFPVRVLLIEGRNPNPNEGFAAPRNPSQVQRANTWEELHGLLAPLDRNTRTIVDVPVSEEATKQALPQTKRQQPERSSEPQHVDQASHHPTWTRSTTAVMAEQDVIGTPPLPVNTASVERHANEFQMPYAPVSQHPGTVEYLSPKNLTEPQRTALEQIAAQHGSIDTYLQHALGYPTLADLYAAFHAAQLDGITLALANLSQGGGMIIGDGTGVGKGREAAAILCWAKRQGKYPLFFTQSPKLFSDIYGDLVDIGKPLTPYIMNHGADAHIVDREGHILVYATGSAEQYRQIAELGREAPALHGTDFLVVNYPQINRDNAQRRALQRLAEDNVIVLDESHNASGDSSTGQFIRDALLQSAACVLYLSATYAKRPNTMPLYYRTDLGNAGLSLPQLIAAIEHGGVALQQVIAADLAKAGQYIRREMDFSQVDYYRTAIDFAHEARDHERSDQVTAILREIVQFDIAKAELVEEMHREARRAGKELGQFDGTRRTSAGVTSTNFTAIVHNIISQMLLAIKADAVVERAIAVSRHPDPAQRKKVVIGLMNTLESHLKALIDAGDLAVGQPVGAYTFSEVLKKALRNTLRYRVTDHTGNSTPFHFAVPGVRLSGAKVGMPLDPISQMLFEDVMAQIEQCAIDLPGSPIDAIIHQLRAAGLKVGELTGRTYTINEQGVLTARSSKQKNKNALVNAFNSGELDVLIINAAGATGLSIHASPKFADQRPRLMLVPQSQLNIDTELQLYGRINRTGQANGPAFEIMQTALPSEIRPAAILQGKMASINANTSANETSHFSLKEIPDMMNKYGDGIVEAYLKENPEIAQMIGTPERGESIEHGDFFRKVSGRMALAPVTIQRSFYEVIEERYRRLIAYLNQMGTNDLVTKNYDFQAKTIFRLLIQGGTDESNPFKASVYVEEVSAKVLAKPYPRARVERDVNANKRPSENVMKEAVKHGHAYLEALRTTAVQIAPDKRTGITHRIEEVEEQLRAIEAFPKLYPVGNTYALSLGDGPGDQPIDGVLVRMAHAYHPKKDAGKNPVVPSAFEAVFYLPDSRQEVAIPLSQQERIGDCVLAGIPEQWDEVIPPGDREIRYLTTGNLLNALGGNHGFTGANLITYTTDAEDHKYGILWTEGTRREEIIRRYASYEGSTADAITYLHSEQVVYAKTDKKHGRQVVLHTTGPAQVHYYPDTQVIEVRVPAGASKAAIDAVIYAPHIQKWLRLGKFVQKPTGWLGVADGKYLIVLLHAMEDATAVKFIIPRENVLQEITADIAHFHEQEVLPSVQESASLNECDAMDLPTISTVPCLPLDLFPQPEPLPAPAHYALIHDTSSLLNE